MKRLFVILSLLGLTACSSVQKVYNAMAADEVIPANTSAVDALLKKAQRGLDPTQSILVATLVNIDNLNQSSRFGRVTSEQISAHLTNLGFSVVELKLRENIFIQGQGELFLSREVNELSVKHKAQGVLVGTYAVAGCFVYLNLKIIGGSDNVAISAHSYKVPLNDVIRPMFPYGQVPSGSC